MKKENKKKYNRGITLIALVITIIVLLILAGVTIAAITGNESAMNKAIESKEKNEQGAELDAIKLAVVSSVTNGLDGYVETTSLKSSLTGLIQETPEDVIIGDGPWVVTSTLGRVYEINKNSTVNELTGLVLIPKNITLSIEGDTYEEKTITARLIDIEGTLTWSDSTDIIDITPSTDGMSATIKAKKNGTDTVTVTCSNGDTTTTTVQVISMIAPKIGDYVQYNIGYKDMYSGYEFVANNGEGWRIIDPGTKDSNGKYDGIKIISTGYPAKIYYKSDTVSSWWKDDESENANVRAAYGLENNFEIIPFTKNEYPTAGNGGFAKITIGNNEQTEATTGAIFKTTKATNVKTMSLAELNELTNKIHGAQLGDNNYRDSNTTSQIDDDTDLINLIRVDQINKFNYNVFTPPPFWWIATPYPNESEEMIRLSRGQFGGHPNTAGGIRPIIELKKVTITWNSTESYWEVE